MRNVLKLAKADATAYAKALRAEHPELDTTTDVQCTFRYEQAVEYASWWGFEGFNRKAIARAWLRAFRAAGG